MNDRICPCGCGASLAGMRADAVYASEACEKRFKRRPSTDKAPTHPLADVRVEQEQIEDKARWTLIVREHMARTLLATGYFHADDLEPLGIPEQHRNIAGSQAGGFVSRGLMEEVGRRASCKPSRKKAKSAIYKITAKGRSELVGLGAGTPPPAPQGFGGDGEAACSPAPSVESGEKERGGEDPRVRSEADPSASPEPLSLFGEGPKRPSMYDPDMDEAA